MGKHSRPKKPRIGSAAAVLAAAAAATGTVAVPPASALADASPASPHTGELLRPGMLFSHRAPERARTYTVRSGDSLASVAAHLCRNAGDWLGIWHASHGIPDPNIIYPGQVLTVTCNAGGPAYSPPAALASYQQQPVSARADNPGYQVLAAGAWPGGAFGNCVVARESGGNAQVMNATGHYGLYQFAYGTWVAYGGSPADFGHASVTEQERVFMNALAAGGQGNWSLYDGC